MNKPKNEEPGETKGTLEYQIGYTEYVAKEAERLKFQYTFTLGESIIFRNQIAIMKELLALRGSK